VWVSFDDGDHWQSLQLNLPHTSMRDLWIHDNDLIVATHGRAFWILDDIEPLREASAALANSAHLFKPAPAYRIQRDTYTDTPLPPDEPVGQNPPDGAIVDYSLPTPAAKVTLEILDTTGHVVRRYASDDKPEATEEELKKQLIPLYWLRAPRQLSTAAGMHRWVWDLHYAAPTATHHDYPIAAIPHDTPRYPLGPNALPGNYSVRLTVDGKSLTAPLMVKMDPRIKVPPADLQKKFQAETRLASLMSAAATSVLEAGSLRKQLEALNAKDYPNKIDIAPLEKKLDALLGTAGGFLAPPAPEPTLNRVNEQAGTLYQEVWGADAAPTLSQATALAAIERDSKDVMKRWNEFKSKDLPALNGELRDRNLGEIHLEADPHQEETQVDEE